MKTHLARLFAYVGIAGTLLIGSSYASASTFSCPVKGALGPEQFIVLKINESESSKLLNFYLLRSKYELDAFFKNPFQDELAKYEEMLKIPNLAAEYVELINKQISKLKELDAVKPILSVQTNNLVKDEGNYIEFVSNDKNLAERFGFPSSTATTNISISMTDNAVELGIVVRSSKSLGTESKFLCEKI